MSDEAPVKVGQIEDLAHPVQRYLLPFQSLEQVLWVVIPVTVFVGLLFAYDNLLDSGMTSWRSWIIAGFSRGWRSHTSEAML